MTSDATPPAFRLSLRELLLLFTATILGFVALRFCNKPWLSGVAFLTLICCIVAVVIALVARGAQQASAIGFIAAAGIYLALIYVMNSEVTASQVPQSFGGGVVEAQTGILPTTLALQALYERISKETYSDPLGATLRTPTGNISVIPPGAGAGGYVSFVGMYPAHHDFIRVGHCLWALLFGYLAAKFARWVYARRVREEPALTA